MVNLPDVAAASREAARWDLEFALNPDASAVRYSAALNVLAVAQRVNDMPDAAVASWLQAAEVATHPGITDRGAALAAERSALSNVVTHLAASDQAERALTYADRLIAVAQRDPGSTPALALATELKADCLQALGRSAEELAVRLDALALFALVPPDESVPEFERVTTTQTARRIAELLDSEGT